MQRADVIKAIDAYSKVSGLKPATICQYAVQNRHVYKTLVGGGDCQLGTAERILRWMEDRPVSQAGAA